MAKFSKKNKKSKGAKISASKLSNKRLNKLAKQGKLKNHKGAARQKLLNNIKDRVHPEQQRHLRPEGPRREEADIPVEEADYDYFARPGRDFSFLSDSSFVEQKKRQKRKSKDPDEADDIVSRFEKVPRSMPIQEQNVKPLLPIKSKEKGIIPRVEQITEDDEVEETHEDEIEVDQRVEEEQIQEPLPPLSTAELYQYRQQKLSETKQRIALLASAILEQPEEGMHKLKELRLMLSENDPEIYVTIRKLVMVSLLEVFKDIIPDYRIRVTTEKEKSQSVKKETKKLRDFEESLLNNYRHYLEYLEFAIKGKAGKPMNGRVKRKNKINGLQIDPEAAKSLQEVAVKCLCELLVTHPHFNYRTNIITVVIPCIIRNQVSDIVCGYIKRIFRADKTGEVTLEVVRLIGRVIKAKRFDVKPKILETFLALRIKQINKGDQSDDNKAARRAKLRQMSRKDRKRRKQMKELENELEEANTEEASKRRLRLHTEIINMVFLTYFRILKNERHSVLLSSVLEGLARFAHLINIDFFDDLFAVLNELVDSQDLTYRESLHCVQTAFTILSGQGMALNIDPSRFYKHLYRTMFQLHTGFSSADVPIALDCLDVMINKRRKQVSHQRLLAYLKRLTTLALQLPANAIIGALATSRGFLQAYPRSDILLDTDCQGSGMFLPELEEPEHCNAHNTALYELHLLQRHYHPVVRRYSSHILAGAPSQGYGALPAELAHKTSQELYMSYDPSDMTFNPTIEKKAKPSRRKVLSEEISQEEMKESILAAESAAESLSFDDLDFFKHSQLSNKHKLHKSHLSDKSMKRK